METFENTTNGDGTACYYSDGNSTWGACNASNEVPCGSYNMSVEMWSMVMRSQRLTYYVDSHVQPLLFIVGMLANCLAIFIFYHMVMMKVCKTLLITLCITDLLTSLFGFLTNLLEIVHFRGNVPYGTYSPEIMEIFIIYKIFLMCLGMSSAVIIITSVIRTYSLRNPLKSRVYVTQATVIKVIVVTMAICLVVFMPTFIYAVWKACFKDEQHPVCAEYFRIFPQAFKARYYFSLMCILLGPGTVIANVVCFILLKKAINKSAREVNNVQSGGVTSPHAVVNNGTPQSGRNQRLNQVILLVLLINTVCILPSCVQVVQVIIDPEALLFDTCKLSVTIVDCIAEIFLSILPSYNFFMYMLNNKDFRNKFRQIVLRRDVPATTPGNTPNWTPKANTPNLTPKHDTPNNVTPKNGTPNSLHKESINMNLINSKLSTTGSDVNVTAETALLSKYSPTKRRQSLEIELLKSKHNK